MAFGQGAAHLKYAVVDIETTGLNPLEHEIIEIGIVRIENGQIADSFQTFVKPRHPISNEISTLTGITQEMVQDAPDIESAMLQTLAFLSDYIVVAHNAHFDMSFLHAKSKQMGHDIPLDAVCTLILSRILLPTLHGHRLSDLAKHFQIETSDVHRALADAVTSAKLLLCLEACSQSLPFGLLQQLSQLASTFSPALEQWFVRFETEVGLTQGDAIPENCEMRDGLLYTAREYNAQDIADESQGESPSDVSLVERAREMLDKDGPLRRELKLYEPRVGQLKMAEHVSTAFEQGLHAVIEAGTGTGKSMAYLIPAALHAKSTKGRVIVSTHTLALQDQIEQRDFPTLQNIFDGSLRLAVQKGRKNYVCLRKVRAEVVSSTMSPSIDIQHLMAMLIWLTQTKEGGRDELATGSVNYSFWSRVQSETDTCINKRCPFFRPCYYFRAKAKAQMAEIVVTNHSLLLSDLKADNRVLPQYDTLVVDEAHHLEEQATKHLGGEVHAAQLAATSLRLSRDNGKSGIIVELLTRYSSSQSMPFAMEERLQKAVEWIEQIRSTADSAFAYLGHLVPHGQSELRLTEGVIQDGNFQRFIEQIAGLRPPIQSLRGLVQALNEWSKRAASDEEAGRVLDAAGFLDGWLEGIELLEDMTVPSEDRVTWIERRIGARPRISVHTAPIDVSANLRQMLFEPLYSVVMTSATLSVKGNFEFIVNQLGLSPFKTNGRLITAAVQSPFDYRRQARLCVPSDIPELAKMSAGDAALWLADSLFQLAVASRGRVLALFTSHQMLKETAKLLRQPLREQNLSLFAQDIDGNRSTMLEAFRQHPESVLLGAQSFWEGIDLPGDQLTTLVIVRLPFAPPSHPVTEARHEKLTASGKSPFWVSSLPEAVVRFRQGFGRLIRTATDKGVVVVYDKRIVTQRYGQTFIGSLPGVRPFVASEHEVLQHIQTFLGQTST